MSNMTFFDKIKNNKISKLFGVYFSEEGGFFVGKFDNHYYFLASNKYGKYLTYQEAVEYCSNLDIKGLHKGNFYIPTKKELSFLGKIMEKFNDKCNFCAEEFAVGCSYMSSEKEGDKVWYNDLDGDECYLCAGNDEGFVRPIRKIPIDNE